MGWQTTGCAAEFLIMDSKNVSSSWQAFLLARTNLSAAAMVRWRVGDSTIIEAVPEADVDFTQGSAQIPAGYTFARSTPGSYWDASGTLQSAPANTPRFDHDPVTLSAKGFLTEETRVNSIRNPKCLGAVAGYPGTPPTNMAWNGVTSGISFGIVGTGTESGIPYVDVRIYGTSTGSGFVGMTFESSSTAAVAANGQQWTESFFTKLVSGSAASLSCGAIIDETNSSGAMVGRQQATFAPAAAPLASQRIVFTQTNVQAATTYLIPWFNVGWVGIVTFDVTIRIGAPQLEKGAFATSPILPAGTATTATTTRASEVLQWTRPSATTDFSIAIDLVASYAVTNAVPIVFSSPAPPLFQYSGGRYLLQGNTGYLRSTQTVSTLVSHRVAAGIGIAGGSLSMDGTAGVVQTAGGNTTPATEVSFGGYGGLPFSGWISRLRIYPSLLTSAQLTALSSAANSSIVAAAYDSGVINAGISVVAGIGYQQSFLGLPSAVTGQFARVDIYDPSNPDGFINIPLVYAGPVFQPLTNFDFSSVFGRTDGTIEMTTRGGQEFPITPYSQRQWQVSLQGIRVSEAMPIVLQIDAAARTNQNILWVPFPTGQYAGMEVTFGRVKPTAGISFPYGAADRRSYKFTVSERL